MLEVIQGWLEGTDHFLFVSWGGLKLKWSLYASRNFYSLSPLKHWPFARCAFLTVDETGSGVYIIMKEALQCSRVQIAIRKTRELFFST